MSATEELRRLLDERDEYYKTSGNKTWWGRPIDTRTGKPINVFHNQAQPMGEDRLFVELQLATPEQAVEATLGRGECHNVHEPPKDTSFWPSPHFKCSECGEAHVSMQYVYYCPSCGRRIVDDCR